MLLAELTVTIALLRPLQINFLFPVHHPHPVPSPSEAAPNMLLAELTVTKYCFTKATPNKFPVSRPLPASSSIARISAFFVLQATIAAVEDLLSATIYDLCCSKALLPWTIFELDDDRMSLREFYHHISTCINVYCKLCGCFTSLKYLLKCKFPS